MRDYKAGNVEDKLWVPGGSQPMQGVSHAKKSQEISALEDPGVAEQ